MEGSCAIGRLAAGGPWIGFARHRDRYEFAVGTDEGLRTTQASDDLLLALAIVYFEDDLEEPPPSIEATHADVSELVRALAARAADAESRGLLHEAVDAIDDGLAVDEVIGRLAAARRRAGAPQVDPLDLVRARASSLSGAG